MQPRIDKGPVGYKLRVYKAVNQKTLKPCTRFHFDSIEEFNHFQYLINHSAKQKDGRIEITLKGLTTKGLTLPGKGPASAEVDFYDLAGTYEVSVKKPGHQPVHFALKVTAATVTLLRDIDSSDSFISLFIA